MENSRPRTLQYPVSLVESFNEVGISGWLFVTAWCHHHGPNSVVQAKLQGIGGLIEFDQASSERTYPTLYNVLDISPFLVATVSVYGALDNHHRDLFVVWRLGCMTAAALAGCMNWDLSPQTMNWDAADTEEQRSHALLPQAHIVTTMIVILLPSAPNGFWNARDSCLMYRNPRLLYTTQIWLGGKITMALTLG